MKIVIKIGSNVLMGNKSCLDFGLMENIIDEISEIKKKGNQILIVTSGAVASGKKTVGDSNTGAAAVGQAILMEQYINLFRKQNISIAQLLLVSDDFKNREKYEHLKQTLNELIDNEIVPIINENDVTSIGDGFGDNDSLASMVAVITDADKLVFLTNLDGLYSADPKINASAKLIKEVKNIDLEIQKMCSKETSVLGRGGMLSKLKGAKLATTCGIETYIINGLNPDNIRKLLLEKQEVGTRFQSQKSCISERKKWLLIGTASEGKIIVDKGAREALENKNSLLAVGVKKIKGEFNKGGFVNIIDTNGEVFAFGISSYSSGTLKELKNFKNKVVVHIDNLTLLR